MRSRELSNIVVPGATSSDALAPSSDALVTSSFLFLVVMPGATSSVLDSVLSGSPTDHEASAEEAFFRQRCVAVGQLASTRQTEKVKSVWPPEKTLLDKVREYRDACHSGYRCVFKVSRGPLDHFSTEPLHRKVLHLAAIQWYSYWPALCVTRVKHLYIYCIYIYTYINI